MLPDIGRKIPRSKAKYVLFRVDLAEYFNNLYASKLEN